MSKLVINRDTQFTIIGNRIIQDRSLSLKAKGIASLMFSLGDGWEVSVERLMEYSIDGRDAVRTAIIELENAGYLRRERVRDDTGMLGNMNYIISENPVSSTPALNEPTQAGSTNIIKQPNIKQPLIKQPDKDSSLRSESISSAEEGKPKTENVPYQKIQDSYNSTCKSLPRCTSLSDKRKKAVKACWLRYGDQIFEAFRLAEESDFLKAKDGSWTGASFDWLMNSNNILKVLEGNYANRQKASGSLSDDEVRKLKLQGKLPSDYRQDQPVRKAVKVDW